MTIVASLVIQGQKLENIAVLNPGNWMGKTWLLEIGGGYDSLYLIAEAPSMESAIGELAEDEKHGHHIVVEEKYLKDYDPDTCHYGPSGQVLDLDHLLIYGDDTANQPIVCRYHGHGLPVEGIDSRRLADFDLQDSAT